MPDDTLKTAKRVLDRERVAIQSMLPAGLVRDSASLDVVAEYTMEMLMVRLSSFVLTEQLADERQRVALDVPATWWQHFKRDHMPHWYRNRWPVKYDAYFTTVTFRAKGVYPYATIPLPPDKFGDRILFETVDQAPWSKR